ncbi:MAG TPA: hypothetical protein VKX46_01155 [Ktedonobacteraceae bacterium]|jgi:hypothetical protein|nr:hypothetical protein [Ktedonobacteraceae bacterium]
MITESKLSDEDYHLIGINQLGRPLDVYRLKFGFIRFLRISSLCIFSIGLISLILTLGLTFKHTVSQIYIIPDLLGSFYALFQGGIFYGIIVRQALSTHVIICEDGLLQIKKMIWRNRVEVVRWNQVRAIKRGAFGIYYLVLRGREAIMFMAYQHIDELLALIKQRSGLA